MECELNQRKLDHALTSVSGASARKLCLHEKELLNKPRKVMEPHFWSPPLQFGLAAVNNGEQQLTTLIRGGCHQLSSNLQLGGLSRGGGHQLAPPRHYQAAYANSGRQFRQMAPLQNNGRQLAPLHQPAIDAAECQPFCWQQVDIGGSGSDGYLSSGCGGGFCQQAANCFSGHQATTSFGHDSGNSVGCDFGSNLSSGLNQEAWNSNEGILTSTSDSRVNASSDSSHVASYSGHVASNAGYIASDSKPKANTTSVQTENISLQGAGAPPNNASFGHLSSADHNITSGLDQLAASEPDDLAIRPDHHLVIRESAGISRGPSHCRRIEPLSDLVGNHSAKRTDDSNHPTGNSNQSCNLVSKIGNPGVNAAHLMENARYVTGQGQGGKAAVGHDATPLQASAVEDNGHNIISIDESTSVVDISNHHHQPDAAAVFSIIPRSVSVIVRTSDSGGAKTRSDAATTSTHNSAAAATDATDAATNATAAATNVTAAPTNATAAANQDG